MSRNDEQFRRECEARFVLKMDDERRQEYYEGAFKARGRIRAQQLVDDVNRMRREIKEKA